MNIDDFIRPSSTDENALCAGRPRMQVRVCQTIGAPPDAAEAELGTSAHHWGDAGINLLIHDENMDLRETVSDIEPALHALREAHEKEDKDYQLDSWTWHCVEQYVRYVHALIVKHDIAPENVLTEEKLDMSDLGFVNKGTADCILVIPFKLVIPIDAKFGFVDQGDAVEHGQIAAYGAAAALRFRLDRAEVHIAQPRAEKANRYTAASFDEATLKQSAAWIRSVNAACREPNPELTPGFTQCSNCKALRLCPAAKEHIVRVLDAYENLGAPSDPNEWGELIGAAKLAEKRAEQVKDLGKAHLVAGGAATGFKLGAGRAMRSVANVSAAIQRLEANGLGAVAMEAVSMSVSKLPPDAADIIKEFITERVSEPSLVADKSKKADA